MTFSRENGGEFDAKLLDAVNFEFKKCHLNFAPKKEQLQAIHAVLTGNDAFVKAAMAFGRVCLLHYNPLCL